MKFEAFFQRFQDQPLIDSASFATLDEKLADIRRQVSGWVKKGYLLQLKKGVYVFNEPFRKVVPPLRFIANYLVTPSYLTLEFALGHYDLIPEKVTVYSSFTTKKTQMFKTAFGVFEYRSVKPSLFFGFTKVPAVDRDFFMATPEKAVLDFFYHREDVQGKKEEFEAFRFQNLEQIRAKRLHEASRAFPLRVRKAAAAFIEFAKEEKQAYVTFK